MSQPSEQAHDARLAPSLYRIGIGAAPCNARGYWVAATGVAAGAARPPPRLPRCLTASSAGPARAATPA